MEWNQYRDSHVGIEGKRIVAIIDKCDDLPCEAYRVSVLGECFVDVESAKDATEKLIASHLAMQNSRPHTYAETILPILKSVVAQLEQTQSKPPTPPPAA